MSRPDVVVTMVFTAFLIVAVCGPLVVDMWRHPERYGKD